MNRNGRRNNFFPTGFSIRRFLVQSARAAAHGTSSNTNTNVNANASSPSTNNGQQRSSCDIEKGNYKNDRNINGNKGNAELISQNSTSRTSSQTLLHNLSSHHHHHQGTSSSYHQRQEQQQQQQHQSSTNSLSAINNNQQSQASSSSSNVTAPSTSKQFQQIFGASSSSSSSSAASASTSDNSQQNICPICLLSLSAQSFFTLVTCNHKACRLCLERYLKNEINESRTDIACPQCSEAMHPGDIETLLKDYPDIIHKYEDFMVRRFLLADPDSRWCPAPDCSYAVIASGCASCPRLRCQRPGCGLNFCYHCKAEWHPDQTCDAARASRQSPIRAPSGSHTTSQDSQHRDDIKPCPRCQVLIVKMDDGSCNHMVCSVCGSEFCWLCMKEISDLHYLSPSGCTFWGKKPWSRKKKLLWQLGILVGAPVGIALVAGIAVPAMIIGIPVWVGKKIYARYKSSSKYKRNCAVLGGVTSSILISPVLAGLVVAIGVPILLFYVYGVVPVSLCRAGCGVSTRDGFKFDFDDDEIDDTNLRIQNGGDGASSVDAVSRIGATSIGEVSLSVASGSHIGVSLATAATSSSGIGGHIGGGSSSGGVITTTTINSLNNCHNGGHSNNGLLNNSGSGGNTSNSQYVNAFNMNSSNRESTTALAGSINGNRLEVHADVSSSASETASAVTCVSDKSGNTINDTASTKALAGSILSSRQLDSSNVSEDGISEKVRFDNTISYITTINPSSSNSHHEMTRKDSSDVSSIPSNQTDHEFTAEKTSLGSIHSYRSSEKSYRDEIDSSNGIVTATTMTTPVASVATVITSTIRATVPTSNNKSNKNPNSSSSLSSTTKRLLFGSRVTKLNPTSASSSIGNSNVCSNNNVTDNNILENISLEHKEEAIKTTIDNIDNVIIDLSSSIQNKKLNSGFDTTSTSAAPTAVLTNSNQSKSSILRNLFFSQQQQQQQNSSNDANNQTTERNIEENK